jgi:hypothetical protein
MSGYQCVSIDTIGGNCPVQAEGVIDGFVFYFRARGRAWSVEIYDGAHEPWTTTQLYSDEPYAAGWMTEDEARAFIEKAAQWFRREREERSPDKDDGQPDEQQEWRDYDPDC